MNDVEFQAAVEQGLEPRGHLANLRLAWTISIRHGEAAGLRETEEVIRRRAERLGGTWNPELTRAWYQRVVDAGASRVASFDRFLAEHPQLLTDR